MPYILFTNTKLMWLIKLVKLVRININGNLVADLTQFACMHASVFAHKTRNEMELTLPQTRRWYLPGRRDCLLFHRTGGGSHQLLDGPSLQLWTWLQVHTQSLMRTDTECQEQHSTNFFSAPKVIIQREGWPLADIYNLMTANETYMK